jgi:hypothetical protein
MRKTVLYFCFALSLLAVSCGPSKEELEKQKRQEDSLMDIERNSALDDADKMLKQADSLDKVKEDSIKAIEEKKAVTGKKGGK